MAFRIGLGNDIHVLEPGNGIMLGGMLIPCHKGVKAVSDGDVLLHALVDALLGAACLGDIGEHYPESDIDEGEPSARFVREVAALLKARGMRPVNVDTIIHLEEPYLSPYKKPIAEKIAELLEIAPDRVNVKAKTSEKLGPVGQGKAVAAEAIVLVELLDL